LEFFDIKDKICITKANSQINKNVFNVFCLGSIFPKMNEQSAVIKITAPYYILAIGTGTNTDRHTGTER
jgi:hypothetical protein